MCAGWRVPGRGSGLAAFALPSGRLERGDGTAPTSSCIPAAPRLPRVPFLTGDNLAWSSTACAPCPPSPASPRAPAIPHAPFVPPASWARATVSRMPYFLGLFHPEQAKGEWGDTPEAREHRQARGGHNLPGHVGRRRESWAGNLGRGVSKWEAPGTGGCSVALGEPCRPRPL